jgi:hypothetical protein
MRILLAGLAAGIAMFVWSSFAHLATPLGAMGISTLPDESVTVGNLASAIGDKAGLYLFSMRNGANPNSSAAAAPGGFLVFNPSAPTTMQPKNLVIEFLTQLAEGLIAAWLLAQCVLTSYAARVAFVSVVGVAAAITTNIPYWNWYRFPTDYTFGYGLTEFLGYVAAGLVLAVIIPSRGSTVAA